jgi:hypothetical protein
MRDALKPPRGGPAEGNNASPCWRGFKLTFLLSAICWDEKAAFRRHRLFGLELSKAIRHAIPCHTKGPFEFAKDAADSLQSLARQTRQLALATPSKIPKVIANTSQKSDLTADSSSAWAHREYSSDDCTHRSEDPSGRCCGRPVWCLSPDGTGPAPGRRLGGPLPGCLPQ